ncbi:hypothetical protein NM208_g10166 [Fusarium decemcellulare]|uniref:Uncharacterized protein n=2 Tax=Fusarium decemcellulare TaxID=57161 RepID=A0ACC1RYU2_9HYPO|nr:hypothetical protein NM208_g12761 [Fusarium decemcellulare]KAJ3528506.1 hypothetical protein NM208_g10166 [Fusarium decemcellulare]
MAACKWIEETKSDRTLQAVLNRLRRMAADSNILWTNEEDEALKTACGTNDELPAKISGLRSANNTERSDLDIIQRIIYLGLDLADGPHCSSENHSSHSSKKALQKSQPWTQREEDFLESLRTTYSNMSERYVAWLGEFGATRSINSLEQKLGKLRKSNRSSKQLRVWTEDEMNYLRESSKPSEFSKTPNRKLGKELAPKWVEKFGYSRQAEAISRKLDMMERETRQPGQRQWKDDEDKHLLDLIAKPGQCQKLDPMYAAYVERFGAERGKTAIRHRLRKLRGQLKAEAEPNDSGDED